MFRKNKNKNHIDTNTPADRMFLLFETLYG